ncbi:MAG: hypothetical protein ACK4K5_03535 [Thermosynechococcus sp.]|uniref:hypothetical protein n=1 Tax=Thermosynechococcus sp. TaxID=2814275 RepID=UPI00391A76E4
MAQLMGQVLGDRYEILQEWASNSWQQTYLALDRWREEQGMLNLFLPERSQGSSRPHR